MPQWLKSFTELFRFWQTWVTVVTTGIPTVWHILEAKARGVPTDQIIFYSSAVFLFCALASVLLIHVVALVRTKIGAGLRAMHVAERLEGMHSTGHGPADLQRVIQLWTGIQDPRGSEADRVDWQIALRQFKQCGDNGHFTFSNAADDEKNPGAFLGSKCDLPSTAAFFRRLAWRGMNRMLRQR